MYKNLNKIFYVEKQKLRFFQFLHFSNFLFKFINFYIVVAKFKKNFLIKNNKKNFSFIKNFNPIFNMYLIV